MAENEKISNKFILKTAAMKTAEPDVKSVVNMSGSAVSPASPPVYFPVARKFRNASQPSLISS